MQQVLPTHLDFTTLYGAARAVDKKETRVDLPLSRLLSLSQFIEAIVLHENITYELGTSSIWLPYADLLGKSSLMSVLEGEHWITPLAEQIDEDEDVTKAAIIWAVDRLDTVSIESLYWSVRFRSGTYAGVVETDDTKSSFINQYIEIANSIQDDNCAQTFNRGMQRMVNNEIGPMGFGVLVRLGLMREGLVNRARANYFPHYSRQPVILSAEEPSSILHRFSMDELSSLRKKLLQKNQSEADGLDLALSPIFIAALYKAKSPEDIIENALKLRNSESAKEYRSELSNIAAQSFDDPASIELYKLRISLRIANLNDFLYERGVSKTIQRTTGLTFKMFPIVGNLNWTKTSRQDNQPGDKAVIFLSDIMRQAIGVIQTQKRIQDVFGISARYDTPIISCASPDFKRRVAK